MYLIKLNGYDTNVTGLIDLIFDLLKEYICELKHQFKRLNIGMGVQRGADNFSKYYILEWNNYNNMDDKKLEQKRKKWKNLGGTSSECTKNDHEEKYVE